VNVGLGATGIAAAGNAAVVANMLAGSISIINLTDYSVSSLDLPAGSRPNQVAISAQANKALSSTHQRTNCLFLRKELAPSTWWI